MKIVLIISLWLNVVALISQIIYLYNEKQYNKETNKPDTDTDTEYKSDDGIVVNPNNFMILDDNEKPCREIPDYNEASKKALENKKRRNIQIIEDRRQEVLHSIETAIASGDAKEWVDGYIIDADPELLKYLTEYKHYKIEHIKDNIRDEYCIHLM